METGSDARWYSCRVEDNWCSRTLTQIFVNRVLLLSASSFSCCSVIVQHSICLQWSTMARQKTAVCQRGRTTKITGSICCGDKFKGRCNALVVADYSVYAIAVIMMPDVSARTPQTQQVSVLATQRIPFFGVHRVNGWSLKTKNEKHNINNTELYI